MKLVDLIVLAVVLGGIGYMVYRTMWKPKSMCPGCDGCSVGERPKDGTPCSRGSCG